jgi:hypothetical protein
MSVKDICAQLKKSWKHALKTRDDKAKRSHKLLLKYFKGSLTWPLNPFFVRVRLLTTDDYAEPYVFRLQRCYYCGFLEPEPFGAYMNEEGEDLQMFWRDCYENFQKSFDECTYREPNNTLQDIIIKKIVYEYRQVNIEILPTHLKQKIEHFRRKIEPRECGHSVNLSSKWHLKWAWDSYQLAGPPSNIYLRPDNIDLTPADPKFDWLYCHSHEFFEKRYKHLIFCYFCNDFIDTRPHDHLGYYKKICRKHYSEFHIGGREDGSEFESAKKMRSSDVL